MTPSKLARGVHGRPRPRCVEELKGAPEQQGWGLSRSTVRARSGAPSRCASVVSKRGGFYPCLDVDGPGHRSCRTRERCCRAAPSAQPGWMRRCHRRWSGGAQRERCTKPAKVLPDLAIGLAVGGDCVADVALLRARPGVFTMVASDRTVSRTIDRLTPWDGLTASDASTHSAHLTGPQPGLSGISLHSPGTPTGSRSGSSARSVSARRCPRRPGGRRSCA
jgi:hypothetical protein